MNMKNINNKVKVITLFLLILSHLSYSQRKNIDKELILKTCGNQAVFNIDIRYGYQIGAPRLSKDLLNSMSNGVLKSNLNEGNTFIFQNELDYFWKNQGITFYSKVNKIKLNYKGNNLERDDWGFLNVFIDKIIADVYVGTKKINTVEIKARANLNTYMIGSESIGSGKIDLSKWLKTDNAETVNKFVQQGIELRNLQFILKCTNEEISVCNYLKKITEKKTDVQDQKFSNKINTIEKVETRDDLVTSNDRASNNQLEETTSISTEQDSKKNTSSQNIYNTQQANSYKAKKQQRYDQDWLNNELRKQKEIEQNSQYVTSQIENSVNTIFANIYREQQFNQKVKSLTTLSSYEFNPDVLLNEYSSKSQELETTYNQKKEDVVLWAANYLQQVNSGIDPYAKDAQLQKSLNEFASTLALNNRIKQIRKEEREKQEQLEKELEKRMTEIKNDVIDKLIKNKNNSYQSSLNVLDPQLESYYYKNYQYYDCMINSINRKFDHKSSDWLHPNCNSPSRPRIYRDLSSNSKSCLDAAKSKYKMSLRYNDKNFRRKSEQLVNSSLSYDNKNADAYYFKHEISVSPIDRYTYIKIANTLEPENTYIERSYNNEKESFTNWFFNAINSQNKGQINSVINNKFHLGLYSKDGLSAIEYSIKVDNSYALDLLIDNEIDKEKTLQLNGYNYFFYSVLNDSQECFDYFIKNGFKADFVPEGKGMDAINLACGSGAIEILKYLINEGYDLKHLIKNYFDNNMLSELKNLTFSYIENAVESNSDKDLNFLKDYYPEIYNENYKGLSVIEYLIKNNSNQVLSSFIKLGWKPESKEIINICFNNNADKCLDILIPYFSKKDFNNINGNLYHLAVDKNKPDLIKIIKKHDHNINYKNSEGNTPLTYSILESNETCAKAIINSKADLDLKNKKGWAPLHISVYMNQLNITKLLCEKGADVNLKGEKDFSPLHYAAMEDNFSICSYLVSVGANKNAKDDWKRTPLKIAKEKKHLDLYTILKE